MEAEQPEITAERIERGGYDPGVTAEGVGMVDVRPMGDQLLMQCTRCPWQKVLGAGGSMLSTLNRCAEDHIDRVHSAALGPGWAQLQASQPDPHVIERPGAAKREAALGYLHATRDA